MLLVRFDPSIVTGLNSVRQCVCSRHYFSSLAIVCYSVSRVLRFLTVSPFAKKKKNNWSQVTTSPRALI